jgi:hypothetical protein
MDLSFPFVPQKPQKKKKKGKIKNFKNKIIPAWSWVERPTQDWFMGFRV